MHRTKDGTEIAGCRPSPTSDRQPELKELEGGNCSPRETLPTKLQAGFFANKTSWVLDSHHLPDKGRQRYTQKTEEQGEAISRSDRARQTLSHAVLGRAQNAGPTESAPLRAT